MQAGVNGPRRENWTECENNTSVFNARLINYLAFVFVANTPRVYRKHLAAVFQYLLLVKIEYIHTLYS